MKLLIAIIFAILPIASAQYKSCFETMLMGDSDHDDVISRIEYPDFVINMSRGKMDLDNDPTVPPTILAAYLTREDPSTQGMSIKGAGPRATAEQLAQAQQFCGEVYGGLYTFFGVDIDFDFCASTIQNADTDGDGILLQDPEYLTFANALTGSNFQGSFADLPLIVQGAYMNYEENGSVSGNSLATPESLEDFCAQVALAVAIENAPAVISPPTEQPRVGGDETLLTQCQIAANASDVDEDSALNQDEYAVFVTMISGGEWEGTPYENLPGPIRDNFEVFKREDGLVDVSGAAEQLQHFISLCQMTELAIEMALATMNQPSNSPAPSVPPIETTTSAPTQAPTAPPTISEATFSQCKLALVISDTNRNDWIDKLEYVRLVSRLSGEDFTGMAFDELDPIFQENYDLLQKDNEFVLVAGSKPGQTPSDEQYTNLQYICRQIDKTIAVYQNPSPTISPSPTSDATPVPTIIGSDKDANTVSEEFFLQCKTAMLVSDINRDNWLEEDEYVRFLNRLYNNAFQGKAYANLNPAFHSSYEQSDEANTKINITGSKPGQVPTQSQVSHLQLVCFKANEAWELYQDPETTVPAPTPATAPSTEAPVGSPTISESYFLQCKLSMVVSDINRDNGLDEAEYIRFLNRFLDNALSGSTLDEIDPIFQTSYENSKQGNHYISIDGSKPGQTPTEDQLASLYFICSETDKTVAEYKNPKPTKAPDAVETSAPATQAPTPKSLSDSEWQQCKSAMLTSDLNGDDWMDPDEYVRFLNRLTSNAFQGLSHSELDPIFLISYNETATSDQKISLEGSKPGATPTAAQEEALKYVCLRTFQTIEEYNDPSRFAPTPAPSSPEEGQLIQQCIAALGSVDEDKNGRLDQEEYIVLVNLLAQMAWNETTFLELPYAVRDNFEWIKGGNPDVDIAGGSLAEIPSQFQLLHLESICRRTTSAVAIALDEGAPVTVFEQCTTSMAIADSSNDNSLDSAEYAIFVNEFAGLAWGDRPAFEDLDPSLQQYFEQKKSSDELISIEGSKPNQNPSAVQKGYLDWFCGGAEEAIKTARTSIIILERCRLSLTKADVNRDDSLGQEEYVTFISYLGARDFGYTVFDDLDEVLRDNYDVIRKGNTEVDISGSKDGQTPTKDQQKELLGVCSETETVLAGIATEPGDDQLRILNAFVLSNKVGLTAADLEEGSNRLALETAYASFLQKEVPSLTQGSQRLRGRQLNAIGLVHDSAEIYAMVDSDCPDSVAAIGTDCMTVFASFKLKLQRGATNGSEDSVYSRLIQEAIAGGKLDAELKATDSDSPLTVVGPSDTLIPSTMSPTPSPSSGTGATKDDTKEEDGGSMDMIIVIAAGAGGGVLLFLAGIIIWCCCCRKKKGSGDSRCCCCSGRKKAAKQEDIVDGDIEYPDNTGGITSFGNQDQREHAPTSPASLTGGVASLFGGGSTEISGPILEEEDESEFNIQEDVQNQPPTESGSVGGNENQNLTASPKRGLPKENSEATFSKYNFNEALAGSSQQIAGDDIFGSNSQPQDEVEKGSDFGQGQAGWGQSQNPWGGDSQFDGEQPADVVSTSQSESEDEDGEHNDDFTRNSSPSRVSRQSGGSRQSGSSRRQSGGSRQSGPSGGSRQSGSSRRQSGGSRQSGLSGGSRQSGTSRQSGSSGKSNNSRGSKQQAMIQPVMEVQQETSGSEEGSESGSEEESSSGEFGSESQEDETIQNSIISMTSEERELQEEYRQQIEELVRRVVPDEIDNVDAMMEQFVGREGELIATLGNMADGAAENSEEGSSYESGSGSEASSYASGSGSEEGSSYESENGRSSYEDEIAGSASYASGASSYYTEEVVEEDVLEDIIEEEYYSEEEGSDYASGSGSEYGSEEGSYYSSEYDEQTIEE